MGIFKPFEIALDFVIIADIIINFITEKIRDVELIVYLKDSAIIYLKTYFLVDLVTILPNLIFWEDNVYVYSIKMLRFIRLKRFFTFFDFVEDFSVSLFASVKSKLGIRNFINFIKLLVLYYLIFHMFACFFIFVGTVNELKEQHLTLGTYK
jgi:hypothetical protein